MSNTNDTSQMEFNEEAIKGSVGRLNNIKKTQEGSSENHQQIRQRNSVGNMGSPYNGVSGVA